MQNMRKFLTALLICAVISPAAVSAENISDTYKAYGEFEQYDFSLFAENSDIDAATEYVLEQIAESQPDTIDISQFNIPYNQESFDELHAKIQDSMRFEHPELFYLSYYFNLEPNDTYTAFMSVVMNEPVDVEDFDGSIIQIMPYTMDKNEIERREAIIEKETAHILSLVNDDMTPIQKVLIVHDYIAAHYSYDLTLESSTLDTMVMQKKGVCQGYAYLFYHVMQRLGIPCINVPSNACGHIWNKVQLDGKWYNIDVTHDDPTNFDTDYSTGSKRTHFLMSDEEIKGLSESDECLQHYTWNNEDYCPADDDSYKTSVLRDIKSFAVYKNGKFYCFDENNNLCTIDFENNVLTPVYTDTADSTWHIEGGYYPSKFSGLTMYAGRIYFNTPNKVYLFDTETNTAEALYTYDGKTDNDIAHFYGLRAADGKLYAEYTENPNEEPELFKIPYQLLPMPCSVVIQPQENNTITADFSIPSDFSDSTAIFIPQYNDKGIFIGFAEPLSGEQQFKYSNECKTIKAFIWDKETHRPLAEAIPHIFE